MKKWTRTKSPARSGVNNGRFLRQKTYERNPTDPRTGAQRESPPVNYFGSATSPLAFFLPRIFFVAALRRLSLLLALLLLLDLLLTLDLLLAGGLRGLGSGLALLHLLHLLLLCDALGIFSLRGALILQRTRPVFGLGLGAFLQLLLLGLLLLLLCALLLVLLLLLLTLGLRCDCRRAFFHLRLTHVLLLGGLLTGLCGRCGSLLFLLLLPFPGFRDFIALTFGFLLLTTHRLLSLDLRLGWFLSRPLLFFNNALLIFRVGLLP